MLEVKNTSDNEVSVMFDGMQVIFDVGQTRAFAEGVARELVREDAGLQIVSEMAPEEVVEAPEVIEGVYTAKENVKGQMQYRKSGKIISKKEYEAR